MSNIAYTCSLCGKTHEEWPALVFNAPTAYTILPEELKKEMAELSSDFCIIRHPGQIDRFIRVTLTLKVTDHCENLDYGVWVSLSEKSYTDYSENFGNLEHQGKYFGWLIDVPGYDMQENIPTTVLTRTNNQRPEIIPHEDFNHSLVHDYYNGISKAEAEKRINDTLKIVAQNDKTQAQKPWWKLWQ